MIVVDFHRLFGVELELVMRSRSFAWFQRRLTTMTALEGSLFGASFREAQRAADLSAPSLEGVGA